MSNGDTSQLLGVSLSTTADSFDDPRLDMAQLALERNEFLQAMTLFECIVRDYGKNVSALIGLGRCHLKLKKYNEAARVFNNASDVDPQNSRILHLLAISLGHAKEYDSALRAFNRAIRLKPNDAELHEGRGNIRLQLNDPRHALEDYLRAMDLGAANGMLFAYCGIAHRKIGRLEGALVYSRKATLIEPKNVLFYINYACTLLEAEQFEQSLSVAQKALDMAGVTSHTAKMMARVFWKLENWEESLKYWTKTIQCDPEDAENYLYRSKCYKMLWCGDHALTDIKVALTFCDQDDLVYKSTYAEMLNFSTLFEEAVVVCNECLEHEDHAEFFALKGEALMGLGQIDYAFELATRAVELDPTLTSGYRLLIRYYMKEEWFEKALELCRKHSTKFAGDDAILLAHTICAYTNQNYEEALEMVSKAAWLKPQEGAVFYNKGLVLEKLGLEYQAVKNYEQCIELDQTFVPAYIKLASIHAKHDRWDEARVLCLDGQNANPDDGQIMEWLDEQNMKGTITPHRYSSLVSQ